MVDRSDPYPEANILAGILMGGLLSLGITDYYFHASQWYFVSLALVLAVFFGWLANSIPPLKRIFTPGFRMENQVKEQAVQVFFEQGLYATRDNTGVLFFISLFEHRVWVLADKGIYEKINQETLQSHADTVALGIKQGAAAEVLSREILKVGDILAEHFPRRADDTNELSDEVIIG